MKRSPAVVDSIRSGRVTHGIFVVSGSSTVAEACSACPVDWLVFDMEASPAGRGDLVHMLQAIQGSDAAALVRIAEPSTQLIEAALDSAADGIIVPKVSTAEQARRVVAAAKYPPLGRRGLNPIRCSSYFTRLDEYLERANRDTLVAVQIETREALDNLAGIAAVEHLDMLFVGCGDLAAELGCIGNVAHPRVQSAIDDILAACRAAGIVPGIFAYSDELAERYRAQGYSFLAVGNDLKIMTQALQEKLAGLRRDAEPVFSQAQ